MSFPIQRRAPDIDSRFLAACLLALCLPTSVARANCEAGGYQIHTLAEYAPSDRDSVLAAEQWVLRWGLRDGELQLVPVAASDEIVIERLHRLLSSDEGESFSIEQDGRSCRPALESVRIAHPIETLERPVLRLEPCGDLHAASSTTDGPVIDGYGAIDGYGVYDRRSRTLRLPPELAVEVGAEPVSEARSETSLAAAALEASLRFAPDAPVIAEDDVEEVRVEHVRFGSAEGEGFWVSTAILRLRHLERLFRHGQDLLLGGYLRPEEVRDRFADFPVIFLGWPGHAPSYFGDGSWCAGARLAGQIGFGGSADRRKVAAADRFRPRRAWDLDADGLPDLLEIIGDDGADPPRPVLYRLGAGPGERIRVVDYPLGC